MSFNGFSDKMDCLTDEFVHKVGIATRILCQSKVYGRYPIACIAEWIVPTISLQQIKFFFSAAEKPVGYVTWAFLAEDVEARWLSDPAARLHVCEWNEGGRLWIMDMVALDGYFPYIIYKLLSAEFGEFEEVRFVRRDDLGRVRKYSVHNRKRLEKHFSRFKDIYI